MFKILDGREAFYQWDVDQKIVVDDRSITQVHYCNRTDDCALICECYELDSLWVADVPNILLQDNWRIRVYAYDGCATRHEQRFDVIARSKPDTYVYTETEVLNYENINKRMDAIEGNIEGAVKDYLEENPVEVDLTGYATETYVNEAVAAIEIPDNALIIPFTSVTDKEIIAEIKAIHSSGLTKPVYLVKRPVIGYSATTSGNIKTLELYTMDAANTLLRWKTEFTDTSTALSFGNYRVTHASQTYVDDAISTIELTPGPAGKDGKDGIDGKDGYTPVKGVDYFDGQDGKDGQDGAPGADGKDYVLTDADKQEIAGMVEVTGGGSGESIEEVYVGTNTPTNENIKIWVNPDEEVKYATEDYVDEAIANIDIPESSGGSVAVDGTTIIQNEDGTISTALGGSKTLVADAVYYINAADETGYTAVDANTSRIDISVPNFSLSQFTSTEVYNLDIEWRNATTGDTGVLSGYITYLNSSVWTVHEITIPNNGGYDCYIQELRRVSGNASFMFSYNPTVYQQIYLTKVHLYKKPVYEYSTIDSGFLEIGDGLKTVNNKIQTEFTGLKQTVAGSIYNTKTSMTENTGVSECYGVYLGYNNQVKEGQGSIVLGNANVTSSFGNMAIVIGRSNTVSNYGGYNHLLIGTNNSTSGSNTHNMCLGAGNSSSGQYGFAVGNGCAADSTMQMAVGKYNIADSASAYNFIIGNGTSASARANGLTIAADGSIVTQGTVSNAGADYAEYFEWADGNVNGEDRVGLMVVLDGNKIRLAQADDEDILGIVSGTATVLGDDAEWNWQGRFLRDDFGRLIMEEVELENEVEVFNEETREFEITIEKMRVMAPKVNPAYDESKEYVSRAKRSEWDAIGMMGKLFLRDDGTCVVNGYAVPGVDGVATLATGKSQMRVMERISDNIVRVCLK